MRDIIEFYRTEAAKVLTHHLNDVEIDIDRIKAELNPDTRSSDYMIFQLRPIGTHSFSCKTVESLPRPTERVKYLFGYATGREILDQLEIYTDCSADEKLPHFLFDISARTLKPILYKDAVLLIEKHKKNIIQQWSNPQKLRLAS